MATAPCVATGLRSLALGPDEPSAYFPTFDDDDVVTLFYFILAVRKIDVTSRQKTYYFFVFIQLELIIDRCGLFLC